MELSLESVSKLGFNAGLVVAVVWLSNRVNVIEERLYDCYEQRVLTSSPLTDRKHEDKKLIFAVIPSDPVGKVKENV